MSPHDNRKTVRRIVPPFVLHSPIGPAGTPGAAESCTGQCRQRAEDQEGEPVPEQRPGTERRQLLRCARRDPIRDRSAHGWADWRRAHAAERAHRLAATWRTRTPRSASRHSTARVPAGTPSSCATRTASPTILADLVEAKGKTCCLTDSAGPPARRERR